MPTEAITALVQACFLAFVLGAAATFIGRLGKRSTSLAWPLALGIGAMAAYRLLLGDFPRLPPRELTEGFLIFIVPLAVAGDVLADAMRWSLRKRQILWVVTSIASPAILFSSRIPDLVAGNSAWVPGEVAVRMAWMIAGLTAGTLAVGTALHREEEAAEPAVTTWRSRPLVLSMLPVFALAGVTLLSSGSYRLGALMLASVFAPLAGAGLSRATGFPQLAKNPGPLILILPAGSLIILCNELANLTHLHAALLAAGLLGPAIVMLSPIRTALRKPWQALTVMVLLGAVPAALAAIPAALEAARAAASNDGY